MTEPEPGVGTHNLAQGGAIVGIQGGNILNSTVHIGDPSDAPHKRLAAGVRCLNAGMTTEARKLIAEAISRGLDSNEVWFHWVLATLSRRSLRELDLHEAEQLRCLLERLPASADDVWKEALSVVCAVLERSQGDAYAHGRTVDELDRLPTAQRTMILQHLALALTGGGKNHLWTRILDQATQSRFADGRQDRVWAYFQPDPAPPRTRVPADATVPLGERLRIVAWSALCVAAIVGLVWSVLVSGSISGVLAGLLALLTGHLGFRTGLDWQHCRTQFEAGERAHDHRLQPARIPEPGLTKSVHNSFEYHAYRRAPRGVDVDTWIAETTGIRNTLSEEISTCYRDSGISVKRIDWLIRHLVESEVRDKWTDGTLLDHRRRYRTTLAVKVACAASCAVSALSALAFLVSAVVVDPLLSTLLATVALISGLLVGRKLFAVLAHRRTLVEQQREYQRSSAARWAAYERWRTKLERTRPHEDEMERWLDCDRTLFLDESKRSCRLPWSEIVSHSFLQTPVRSSGRSRVLNGPWRYGSYRLRLFLVTHDGVREFATVLDFRNAQYNGRERHNYRFDAVASVQVAVDRRSGHSLELTLVNGPARTFRLIDDPSPDLVDGLAELSEPDLDATGFTHTFSLLEGIAAEGRSWIAHDERRRLVTG